MSSHKLYGRLLRVLPRSFVERHGREMTELFVDALAQAGASRVRRAQVWAGALRDLLVRALVERTRGRLPQRRPWKPWLEWRDVRYALRTMRRQPAVSALVVGMLALAITANTAVFAIVNGLFLRPLPFESPDRLVYLNETAPRWNLDYTGINYPDFHQWRTDARVFEGLALIDNVSINLSEGGQAERLEGARVTHEYAEVLRVEPLLGRMFLPAEDAPAGELVVVLGEGLWRSRFAADRGVLGRTIRINSAPHVIVGVLPARAEFPTRVDLWLPMRGDPAQTWQSYGGQGVGRLKPGVSISAALEDLMRAHAPIFEQRDTARIVTPLVMPLRERFVSQLRTVSITLVAAVAVVLLIACANIASLMFARALSRQRELVIRLALGAGRARVLRQLFTENLVFAALGGAVGTVTGLWLSRLLVSAVPEGFPEWARVAADARVLAFSALLACGAAVLFGLAPALHVFRGDARGTLQVAGNRTTRSAAGRRTFNFLTMAEVALSALLLVTGGLLLRAYQRVNSVDPGFAMDNVVTFGVALPASTYDTDDKVRGFWNGLIDRLNALPGVTSAGAITCPPLGCHWGSFFEAEGAAPRNPGEPDPVTLYRIATPDYFKAMGIRLARGRFFAHADGRTEGNQVVVVNETFARTFWPGVADPVGRRLRQRGDSNPWLTVVGVARDVKHYGLDTPMRPGLYMPLAQSTARGMTVVLSARSAPSDLIGPARQVVRDLDADLPIFRAGTMEQALQRSMSLRQTYSWALSIFALAALLLAVGGIYGVTSYAVTRRTRELGIRVALGAAAGQVMRSVLRGGMTQVIVGLACGLAGAFAAARAMSSLLFGIRPGDPLVYAGVALILVATAMIANWFPARRAARVDPMTSLRTEG